MSDNYMINAKLSDLTRSIWNLNDHLSSLRNNFKKNSDLEKDLLKSMNEILKSNQRIEESINELTELKKYELGLLSKFSKDDSKNNVSSPKTIIKRRF